MLEAAEADLALEAGFCPCERSARHSRKFWSPSSSTRTNGVSGFAMAASVLSRAARRTSSTQAAGPSEGVGRRVRIRLAPTLRQERTVPALVTSPPTEMIVGSRDPLPGASLSIWFGS